MKESHHKLLAGNLQPLLPPLRPPTASAVGVSVVLLSSAASWVWSQHSLTAETPKPKTQNEKYTRCHTEHRGGDGDMSGERKRGKGAY